MKIARTTDATVRWVGALGSENDLVQVRIDEAWGSKSVTADCRFPVPAQIGVIPVAVTSKFNRSATASNPGTVSVRPLRESERTSGNWNVVFRAIGVGLIGDLVTF